MAKWAGPRDDEAVVTDTAEARSATLVRVAVAVAVIGTIAVAVALWVAVVDDLQLDIVGTGSWINLVAVPAFPLLAALVLRRSEEDRPPHQDRLAWLFLGFGVLCAATIVLHIYADYALRNGSPLSVQSAWVSSWLWIGVPAGLLLILLLFPTGELPGPRWVVVAALVGVAYVAVWVSVALGPGRMTDFAGDHPNPLGWHSMADILRVLGSVGMVVLACAAIGTVAAVVWRFRRGDAAVRAQLRWLVVTVGVIALTIALPVPNGLEGAALVLNVVATFLLPVALGVALTRRDGLLLPRVLVYGLLSVLLLIAFLAIVGLAEALFGARAEGVAGVVAAGVVAVVVAPLRTRLQHAVDRLVYGDRGDPYEALSDLGRRLASSPNDLLNEAVLSVADALRAPYAAVILTGDTAPTAAVGTPTGDEMIVPLSVRGSDVGSLLVSPRGPRERYGERDLALVSDLSRHIAVAAHAAALTRDLLHSRESLVIAREEERRRIRRDLHDGLGPALAGIAFGIDAARNTLTRDAAAADAALAGLKAEVQTSVADVRRLVYDLRPPALDQLGLVSAVEEYGARLAERGALSVTVSSPALPPLPAAVEVAAYRIAIEALTNAARHSRARTSRVSFEIDDSTLRLQVVDDGDGMPAQRTYRNNGLGMSAMAERAAELGGSCSVGPRSGGGTAVTAVLPLRSAP
ncbi:sensor histidine kinase [Kribbella sp. NBC_00359]|uniref:sensor histidine kinase n=1 Tax=Kribbella sp. NBC_00359 TaxID=2975966 RepID=UPI002E1AF879